MEKRFVVIWFSHLLTDWMVRRNPSLKEVPFIISVSERGRMVVTAANVLAQQKGIFPEMIVADCRAVLPSLEVFDNIPGQREKLLSALAEWSLRYTPIASVCLPDDVILDVSGCPHLWGGEQAYLRDIVMKLKGFGYNVKVGMADTVGTAWAIAHYSRSAIIDKGAQLNALLPLPPVALRIEPLIAGRLQKLGLHTVGSFINMPRSALRRRFGQSLLSRLDQALGQEIEVITPIKPIELYQERLPCLDPIRTASGIEIALRKLLETLCKRLQKEGKGIRQCSLKAFRVDNNIQQIQISTTRATRNIQHLFKLFEMKISLLEPDLGFELFLIEASVVEDIAITQDALWNTSAKQSDAGVAELLDKIAGKFGMNTIHRYLPDEHHWPERSLKVATTLNEVPTTEWRMDRPLQLLAQPEPIEVTVPIPDYPPMLFVYKNTLHNVRKADGPERIEQEWWLQEGLYRDYYCIEDEHGARYWVFRLGHYNSGEPKWFIHGFFE